MNHHKKKNKLKGSLTVEAALILPLFLYCMVGFIYLFQIIYIHEYIQNSLTDSALSLSKYGYIYEQLKEGSIEEDTQGENNIQGEKEALDQDNTKELKKSVLQELDIINIIIGIPIHEYIINNLESTVINQSLIVDGMDGIGTYLSSFMEENDRIDLIVHYNIKLPFGILSVSDIPILQRVTVKAWTGIALNEEQKENENDLSDNVYVTEYGSVYHKTMECSYINIKIKKIAYQEILKEPSSYLPCDICVKKKTLIGGEVYITNTGDKYHSTTLCRSLKRLVKTVHLEDIEGYNPCSSCYKSREE